MRKVTVQDGLGDRRRHSFIESRAREPSVLLRATQGSGVQIVFAHPRAITEYVKYSLKEDADRRRRRELRGTTGADSLSGLGLKHDALSFKSSIMRNIRACRSCLRLGLVQSGERRDHGQGMNRRR